MTPKIFNFKQNEVRTIMVEEQTWFVALDIINILNISDNSQAVEKLDEDEKLMRKIYVAGQKRDTWTINEFGLYRIILMSSKPEAKLFKRWIIHDILPAIRKAGKYTTEERKAISHENQELVKLKLEKENTISVYKTGIKDLKNEINEIIEKLQENIINPNVQKRIF